MTQMKDRAAACQLWACQRQNDCMHSPCKSPLAVIPLAEFGSGPGSFAFTSFGKQVLIDGRTHYADACDPEAAETIVQALNERRERLIAERELPRIVNYRCAPAVSS